MCAKCDEYKKEIEKMNVSYREKMVVVGEAALKMEKVMIDVEDRLLILKVRFSKGTISNASVLDELDKCMNMIGVER